MGIKIKCICLVCKKEFSIYKNAGIGKYCSRKCYWIQKSKDMAGYKNPKYAYKHGMSKTKIHRAWAGMKNRCLCPTNKDYKDYGGRGITVDKDWFEFENFYKDMGIPPDEYSLDRIDNEKGYSKDNCRWTKKIVQQNNRRMNIKLTYKGKTKTLPEWARITGINYHTMLTRYYRNWSIDKLLSKRRNNEKCAEAF